MNDDLEKTKPIKTLKEINTTRSERHLEEDIEEEITSREEKYAEKEAEKIDTEMEEQAEEALAEKNINKAEELLKEEQPKEEEPPKKGLINKIKNLSKKGKIILFSCIALFIILIIVLLVVLLGHKKEEPKKQEIQVKEEVPEIVDNFYYKEGKLYILDENQKTIGEYECTNKDEKLCFIAINTIRDTFDTDRYLDTSNKDKVRRIPIIENDLVFIVDKKSEKDTTVNIYSLNDKKVLESFNEIKMYNDNQFIAKNLQSNYGFYTIEDGKIKEVIKPTYSYLGMISYSDNLVAKNSKGYIIINKSNKVLSNTIVTGDITDYSSDLIVVKVDGKYNVYNYKAEVLEVENDFVKVIDGYMALANGKKLIIKDSECNKFTEEGITLKNTDYIKTYIYDENGKVKEKRRSFDIEKSADGVTVTIFEEGKEDATYVSIDKTPVIANKKHKYINYLDNKLYIYKDEQKEDVLGTYSCGNKNFLGTASDDYDACYIASDTIFEDNEMTSITGTHVIPIINLRFAFVKDGDSIYLYDLIEKKTLGTYSDVNTYSDANTDATLIEKTVNAIVKNKKGKFAMLQIGSSSASKLYNFEYNHMEKMGKYILALKENGKWVLFKDQGSTNEFDNKVIAYNEDSTLFKAKNEQGYLVYDSQAKKISTEIFKHVELSNKYFIGITSKNELNIYDLTGKAINKTPISLNSTEYTGDKKAYKVSYSNGIYTISVRKDDSYIDTKINEKTGTEEAEEPEVEQPENPEQPENQGEGEGN